MNGYKEAEIIDNIINGKLESDPIVPKNASEWLTFARTVKSSMEIIEQTAKDIITSETKRIIREKRDNEIKDKQG